MSKNLFIRKRLRISDDFSKCYILVKHVCIVQYIHMYVCDVCISKQKCRSQSSQVELPNAQIKNGIITVGILNIFQSDA